MYHEDAWKSIDGIVFLNDYLLLTVATLKVCDLFNCCEFIEAIVQCYIVEALLFWNFNV